MAPSIHLLAVDVVHELEVDPGQPHTLLDDLEAKTGTPAEAQTLLHNGHPLGQRTLREAGIQPGDTVRAAGRVRGGSSRWRR